MGLQYYLLLASCILISSYTEGKGNKKLEKVEGFDVKPSGTTTHQTIKLENGVTCVFTYTAVGGTNEEWTATLTKIKQDKYTCIVERPDQVSYLFFMDFAMSILEYDVEEAEVFDNSGALLQDEDFVVTDDSKSVKHKDGTFQSNLSKVILTARKRSPQ